MVSRLFELKAHLYLDDDVIADLVPRGVGVKKLKTLLEELKKIQAADFSLTFRCHRVRPSVRVSGGEASEREAARDEPSGAWGLLKRARCDGQTDHYQLVAVVAPMSNVAERLFSVARSTIRLDRHSLQPIMLESILFLKLNRSYWGVETVHECLEHDWDDEDEDATAN
ncbi:hypothetical protein JG688_00014119 [Phytophthora aleatoria]|uniref:HAT C-terminal dimerisation domain-containing protein n=1 Tax=Phytophthora aleatoria TaxID=2496075 RepID=A0A8J5ME52_9STRA|nr:hypothetical protein JG688_00014119 [Phytophthora aleatoria]